MPKLHVSVSEDLRTREIHEQFPDTYRELQLRSFTAGILTQASTLRKAREADHKVEFENLFVRRPIN